MVKKMNLTSILDGYRPYQGIVKNLDNTPISVSGVAQTAQAQLISAVSRHSKKNTLIITYSDMESRSVMSDLRLYTDNAVLFPSKEYVFYNIDTMGRASENARLSVLDKIITGGVTVVASVDAIMCYTAEKSRFIKNTITIKPADELEIGELAKKLVELGYKREEMTEGVGQFSIRGGICDVFVPGTDNPVRLEFWGDEIDSVRSFDVDSQRTLENIESIRIIPVTETLYSSKRRDEIITELVRRLNIANRKGNTDLAKTLETDIEMFKERHSFPAADKYISLIYGEIPTVLDYFDKDTIAFVIDPKRVTERIKTFLWEKDQIIAEMKFKGIIGSTKSPMYKSQSEIILSLSGMKLIALEMLSHTKNDFVFNHLESFDSKTTVSFHGKLEYLYDDVQTWQQNKYTIVLLAATETRVKNLYGVFNERQIKARISEDGQFDIGETVIIKGSSTGGFEYPELKLAVVSEQEIFKSESSRAKRKKDSKDRIKSYNEISVGDYVVHAAHGVGVYQGINKVSVEGVSKDYLKIEYKDNDVLYIPVDQLSMLYKYSGKSDDKAIKINKLGTQDWSKKKQRVKESTDELAKELIKLYAQREEVKGYAFSEDSPWQRQFEDTFEYAETTDQLRCIEEVKSDMEKPVPMDRLLCGDVGFGKTEVALRAAFKAVCDSKQVVYLCPTTVLAMQHYETFKSRMADFPINVEMLSRFRSTKEQTEIIKKLKDGRIDIIIGTHRLLSEDVVYKDLGLLIIDEEQRFGVGHKERIKEMKTNIDVLTLTATPIPRTLHMAMTSVRDMSVLSEPPGNRYPVQTYVLEYDEDIVCDAINKELSRGGQVFYLYNRVQSIYYKAEWLKKKFPDANIAVGHGKMKESELEDIMYDMVNGTTDILICTTIIETGLDIPNANTMIIERADRMGLAQLYQLRGRVGRSNRMAYAYLTYRPDQMLSSVSQKRLSAIREFTEFGSGFKIAMRDLEIRGAGNVLGVQQHGHMGNVGYDMYCKILSESINEARGETVTENMDVAIDINVNAYIPESYIPSAEQRINMYKKISVIENEDDESEISDELIDRYGDMPKPVMNILSVAGLKVLAREVGCVEITQRHGQLTVKFTEEMLTPDLVFGLDGKFRGRVKLVSQEVPGVIIKLTERDSNILEFVKKILILIKELQNTKK